MNGSSTTPTIVATIAKSQAAELRISLTNWRGANRVELREATATIPGCYFPTSNGITLDVERLPALVFALHAALAQAIDLGLLDDAARAEAKRLGLLSKQGRAA